MDFEVRPEDFNGFWSLAGGFGIPFGLHFLNISWFLLICLILTYLLFLYYFLRAGAKKACSPASKTGPTQKCQPDEETWEQKSYFFLFGELRLDRSIPAIEFGRIWWPPRSHFRISWNFAIFGSPGVSRLASGDLPSLRPEHFNGFWSPARAF